MSRSTGTLLLGSAALLAAALVIALIGGSDSSPDATATSTTTEAAESTASTTTTTTITTTTTTTTTLNPRAAELLESTRRVLQQSTPEELAYRLVVTGLTGTDLTGRLTETVGSTCVGGLFFTESNGNWSPIDDPEAFRTFRMALPTTFEFPALVTTDAELGSVVRVPVDSPAPHPTGPSASWRASSTTSCSTYRSRLRPTRPRWRSSAST